MKNPFKRFTIALTGDFGQGRSHEKMRDWVEANGGTFSKQVNSNVTHLVCSLKDWKKAPNIVKEALKIKKLKIVTFDWFEDSLMQQSPKREGPYLLKRVGRKAQKEKARKKVQVKRAVKSASRAFEKGCQTFNDEIHSQGYHIYRDETDFEYEVVLARADLATNKNERYTLKASSLVSLYESHTPPHLYSTYVKYSSASTRKSASDIRAPVGSTFEIAFGAFTSFFRAKTGRTWDHRLDKLKVDEGMFVYTSPKLGWPRGRMPSGWMEMEAAGLDADRDAAAVAGGSAAASG
ncbi:hypothetical protein MMC16_007106 [Acarospora aff. strigata]|nr:hypothetical protein [Acarospora aff. strigata]